MYGGFLGDHRLTRWAIVFLIIFVLFILLVPEREEREKFGYYGGAVGAY